MGSGRDYPNLEEWVYLDSTDRGELVNLIDSSDFTSIETDQCPDRHLDAPFEWVQVPEGDADIKVIFCVDSSPAELGKLVDMLKILRDKVPLEY